MQKITEYNFVGREKLTDLIQAVNSAIQDGWQPYGELILEDGEETEEGIGGGVYIQIMVKYESPWEMIRDLKIEHRATASAGMVQAEMTPESRRGMPFNVPVPTEEPPRKTAGELPVADECKTCKYAATSMMQQPCLSCGPFFPNREPVPAQEKVCNTCKSYAVMFNVEPCNTCRNAAERFTLWESKDEN